MTKTRLEVLGEQIMHEIQENKKWNERAVSNEALDQKLDVVMEYVQDIPKIREDIRRLQNDMEGVKTILQDHTERLRRLEDEMSNLETRMGKLQSSR
jgi:archaellum component FlaC